MAGLGSFYDSYVRHVVGPLRQRGELRDYCVTFLLGGYDAAQVGLGAGRRIAAAS